MADDLTAGRSRTADDLTAGGVAGRGIAVIDLGNDFQVAASDEQSFPSKRHARRPGDVAAAVVLLLLLGLGASAAPGRAALVRAARISARPGASAMVAGTIVVVSDASAANGRIAAYQVTTGRRIWSTPLPTGLPNTIYRIDGTVLISYRSGPPLTVGISLATGRLRWTVPADLASIDHDRLLVTGLGPGARPTLTRLDPLTGSVLWTRPIGSSCEYDLAADDVELCPQTGLLRVIDLDTGQVRGRRRLDMGSDPQRVVAGVDAKVALSQTAGVVLVGHETATGAVLEGFSARDLSKLWSRPFSLDSSLFPCGAVFCMYDGRIATGIDPRTGETMPFPGFAAVEDRGLPNPELGSGPVRLNTKHALIPVGASPGPDGTYPGASAITAIPDSAPMTVPGPTRVDSFLAAVDPAAGTMRILQRLHGIGVGSCVALGGYLACEELHNHLQFWRLQE